MSRTDAYSVREAIACSAFGYHLAAVHPDQAKFMIDDTAGALSQALDKALKVKITEDIIDAFADGVSGETIHDFDSDEARAGLIAAFRAAGFEVEE